MEQGRKEKELLFHDEAAAAIDLEGLDVEHALSPVAESDQLVLRIIGSVEGKRILDLGCGAGLYSVFLARRGAKVCAVDLSPKMLELTRQLAERHGLTDKVEVSQMAGERLGFQSSCFDLVWSKAILHHLDVERAIGEIARCLRKGGELVLSEPLGHNPLANLYRYLAATFQRIRTPEESPLTYDTIERFRSLFSRVEKREFILLSSALFAFHYLRALVTSTRLHPQWVNDVRTGKVYPRLMGRMQRWDEAILRRVPALRRYCNWVVVHCVK